MYRLAIPKCRNIMYKLIFNYSFSPILDKYVFHAMLTTFMKSIRWIIGTYLKFKNCTAGHNIKSALYVVQKSRLTFSTPDAKLFPFNKVIVMKNIVISAGAKTT